MPNGKCHSQDRDVEGNVRGSGMVNSRPDLSAKVVEALRRIEEMAGKVPVLGKLSVHVMRDHDINIRVRLQGGLDIGKVSGRLEL